MAAHDPSAAFERAQRNLADLSWNLTKLPPQLTIVGATVKIEDVQACLTLLETLLDAVISPQP